jgi:hypothetical protein
MSEENKEIVIGINNWVTRYRRELLSSEMLGMEPWSSLLVEIQELALMLDKAGSEAPLKIEKLNPVDASGMGKAIIKMNREGLSYKEISDSLALSTGMELEPRDIKIWLETYNHSSVSSKASLVRGSVFETKGRLEEVHLLIHKHIEDIEMMDEEQFTRAKTTKAQVMLDVYKEMRQLYKDANQLVNAVQQLNTIKEFQEVVLNIISDISPQAYHQILKELKQRKALMSSLMPDDI